MSRIEIVHAFETIDSEGEPVEKNLVSLNDERYVVYKGKKVSFAYRSQVNCPGYIGNGTFVGKQAFIFKAKIGNKCIPDKK